MNATLNPRPGAFAPQRPSTPAPQRLSASAPQRQICNSALASVAGQRLVQPAAASAAATAAGATRASCPPVTGSTVNAAPRAGPHRAVLELRILGDRVKRRVGEFVDRRLKLAKGDKHGASRLAPPAASMIGMTDRFRPDVGPSGGLSMLAVMGGVRWQASLAAFLGNFLSRAMVLAGDQTPRKPASSADSARACESPASTTRPFCSTTARSLCASTLR